MRAYLVKTDTRYISGKRIAMPAPPNRPLVTRFGHAEICRLGPNLGMDLILRPSGYVFGSCFSRLENPVYGLGCLAIRDFESDIDDPFFGFGVVECLKEHFGGLEADLIAWHMDRRQSWHHLGGDLLIVEADDCEVLGH